MAQDAPSEPPTPRLGRGIATVILIALAVALGPQIGWYLGEQRGGAQGSWVGFWIGLIASFGLSAAFFKLLYRRNPEYWTAALRRVTRPMLSVLAYRPTRSYPFGMIILGGVWLTGSLVEYFHEIPRLERLVGAPTGPTEMTLRAFLDGPGGPEHVRLTDFAWCREYGSYVPKRSRRPIYCIPIVPRDGADAEPMPRAVSMVVMIYMDPDDVPAIRKRTEVQGLVEDMHTVDIRVEEQILAAYPGTDAKRCRVLREGATLAPVTAETVAARRTEAYFHLAVSGGLTAVGLLLFIRHCRRFSQGGRATPSATST